MPDFKSDPFFPVKGEGARLPSFLLCAGLPFFFGVLGCFLGQDANWDLRNYHFYNAYAFLNDRYGRDFLPSQLPYFYNPLIDVPFFVLTTHFSAWVSAFVLGTFQGLNAVLLFMISHASLRLSDARAKVFLCAGIAFLGMVGGGGAAQLGTTFGDNVISLGVLGSAALVVRFAERLFTGPWGLAFGLALLLGVPVGLVSGLKLPSVIYAVGLCAGLLFAGRGRWIRGFWLSFAFGLGVVLGAAATYGHWGVFLYEHFENPFFPYFNDFFQSPFYASLSSRDTKFIPETFRDHLLMPFLMAENPFRVGEIAWRDWRLPLLYVLLPMGLLARAFFSSRAGKTTESNLLAHSFAARYLLAAFSIVYVLWLTLFSIYRYAVTIEMIAPLLIVFALGFLPLKNKIRTSLLIAVFAAVLFSVKIGNWDRRDVWSDRFIEAQVPELEDPARLMILMAGQEPYAHLVPSFPPEISFVRIQSNISSPEQDFGLNRILWARIERHRRAGGRFMLFVPSWGVKEAAAPLAYFGLKVGPEKCLTAVDAFFRDHPFSLCSVVSF